MHASEQQDKHLTDAAYWEGHYQNEEFSDFDTHSVALYLQKYLEDGFNKTSLEVGSYPGSFVPTIARKGYTVNGIDFNKNNSTHLLSWLKQQNIQVGEFISGDFFEHVKNANVQYDLVCSFGFVEHFVNYKEVILAHASLVKPGGQLIITVPNFKGFMQHIPHQLFDKENLSKHYVPSMSPKKWKEVLLQNGFTITHCGYFGGYQFWVDRSTKRSKLNNSILRFTERVISQFNKIFNRLGLESRFFSAYCGIVAKRVK